MFLRPLRLELLLPVRGFLVEEVEVVELWLFVLFFLFKEFDLFFLEFFLFFRPLCFRFLNFVDVSFCFFSVVFCCFMLRYNILFRFDTIFLFV